MKNSFALFSRHLPALLTAAALTSCSRNDSHPANLSDQTIDGKAVYEMACAQCHYDGTGSTTAPDLKGSAALDQPPAQIARIILKGQSGVSVVDGKPFKGIMPAQAYLSDAEIAAVTVYVRQAFAGKTEPISPADVAALRQR